MAAAAEGQKPGGIFLSYRRDDTRHLAGRVYDRLAERFGGGRVFMDVDSIEPGLDFEDVINSALASCGVMLALIGPTWLTAHDDRGQRRLDNPDDFLVLELTAALHQGIRVLPVLADGAAPPRAMDLPEALRSLARRHAVRLDHETFRSDVNELLTTVARILERPSPGPPKPRRPTQEPVNTRVNPPTMRPTAGPSVAPSPEPVGSHHEHPAADEGVAHGASAVTMNQTAGRKKTDSKPAARTARPRALSAPSLIAAGVLAVVTALTFIFTRPSDSGTSPPPTTPSVSAISTQTVDATPAPSTSAAALGPVVALIGPLYQDQALANDVVKGVQATAPTAQVVPATTLPRLRYEPTALLIVVPAFPTLQAAQQFCAVPHPGFPPGCQGVAVTGA